MAESKRYVLRVWRSFLDNAGHDHNSFGHLHIVSARPGLVKATMEVKPHQVNRMKTLHGGLTSSLVDTMGSLAVSTKGFYMSGVSTDIHVTFVRAAKLGEEIAIKGEVVGQGKNLAYTRIEIESVKSGKLLAFGSHTKFIGGIQSPHDVKISDDGENIIE